MARTRKNIDNLNINQENETDSMLELKERIAQLEKFILEQSKTATLSVVNDEDNDMINPNKYVRVVSLCPHKLNLSTEKMGRGRIFSFESFGEVKRILYSDITRIIDNNRSFLSSGLFYIEDKEVIRQHGLNDIYDKLLDKGKIERIFDSKIQREDVLSLYNSANSRQKEIIEEIFIEKAKSGVDLDMNIISSINNENNNLLEKIKDIIQK